jgi:transposase-like protein
MPTRFGATDNPVCPKCKNRMRLTRRTSHPVRGYDFERQTFTCSVCQHEIERDADSLGEIV